MTIRFRHHAAGRVPQQFGDGQVVRAVLEHPLREPVPQVVRRQLPAVLAGQLEDLFS
jgi:hypothetical protein